MKLIIDMNLSPRWEEAMAALDIEAVHWSKIGSPTASDAEIMSYAMRGELMLLTHDLDFGAILAATGGGGPSVVQLRADDTSPQANAASVASAMRQCEAELEAGALLTVDSARTRLTLLPLRR